MNDEPLLSVLVLAYNHEAYIEECIDSFLNSQYKSVEIIVLDNGSSDRTFEKVSSLKSYPKYSRLEILRAPHGNGVNDGLNFLLSKARGDLVCFISGDDYTFSSRISTQVQAFTLNSTLKACYGVPKLFEDTPEKRRFWDSPLLPTYKQTADVIKTKGLDFARSYHTKDNPIYMIGVFCIQASMFNTKFVLGFGGFDEECLADDIVFNFRVFNALQSPDQILFIEEPCVGYRQHPQQTHRNFIRQSQMLIQALEKYTPPNIRKTVLANAHMYNVENSFLVFGLQYFSISTSQLFRSLQYNFSFHVIVRYFYLLLRASVLQLLGKNVVNKIKNIPKLSSV